MKKIVWRLKEQPTTENIRELVKDKILTNEEAREILFNRGDSDNFGQSDSATPARSRESLEEEIKFLRALVEKLSSGRDSRVVEIIKTIEVEKPVFIQKYWYEPYKVWCGNITSSDSVSNGSTFNSIQTF